MNLADVFTILFIILGFLIVFVAYWLMAAGLFPRFTERCAAQIGRSPVLTPTLGLVTLAPVVVVGLIISGKAPNNAAKIFGLAIALIGVLLALFGSAGLALRIGEGLRSSRDEIDPWRRVLRGAIVLALTFALPFIGTFVLMPYAFASGFGAWLICLFKREPERVVEAAGIVSTASPQPMTPSAFPIAQ